MGVAFLLVLWMEWSEVDGEMGDGAGGKKDQYAGEKKWRREHERCGG